MLYVTARSEAILVCMAIRIHRSIWQFFCDFLLKIRKFPPENLDRMERNTLCRNRLGNLVAIE